MNFIKKAQKNAKDIQATVTEIKKLEKSAASLGISFGKKKEAPPAEKEAQPVADSSGQWKEATPASTAASTSVNTPVTPASAGPYASPPPSAAPQSAAPETAPIVAPVVEKPKIKLSLVQRKNLRDEWEKEHKETIEKRLSAALKAPWTVQADAAVILNPKPDGPPADVGSPGNMIFNYFDSATSNIETFVKKFGEAGIHEINTLAPSHVFTLDLDDRKYKDILEAHPYTGWQYNRPWFNNGVFYLLINRDNIWSNAGQSCYELEKAVYLYRDQSAALANQIDFECIRSIQTYWEEEADKLVARARELTKNPKLEFEPNWQATWAALDNLYRNNKKQKTLDWGWREQFAHGMFGYFQSIVNKLSDNGFEDDEMLQEAFNEAVDKNKIEFEFRDKMTASYNEVLVEEGVLKLITKVDLWRTNENAMGEKIMSIL